MRKNSKKLIAVVAGSAAAVALSGVAYAWWTSAGSGTGSGTASNAANTLTNATLTGTLDNTALVPGAPKTNMTISSHNLTTFTQQYTGDVVSISGIKCGVTSVPAAWFTVVDSAITSTTLVAPGATTTLMDSAVTPASVSGVTVSFNNDALVNQNVCQNATVSFALSAAQATPLP